MTQKSPSAHCRTTLSGYIFATKAHIDNRKKLVKQQYLPTCPYNMVNFGPLAADIGSLVWGTPANFNGFRVLAALLHGTLVVGVSQTTVLNTALPVFGRAAITADWLCYSAVSGCFLSLSLRSQQAQQLRFS